MTTDQFFEKLREATTKFNLKWQQYVNNYVNLNYNAASNYSSYNYICVPIEHRNNVPIRATNSKGAFWCPITAVYYLEKGRSIPETMWTECASIMELGKEDAQKIVDASDFVNKEPELRSKLVKELQIS